MSLALKQELEVFLASQVSDKRNAMFQRASRTRTRYLQVVLEDVADPHDACAVMRSVECFGVQDMHIISQRADFKLVSGVAVGSSKWLTLHRHKGAGNNTGRCLTALKEKGYRIGMVAPGGTPVKQLCLDQPLALCFGSAELGFSDAVHEHAQEVVSVAAHGFTQTFNLSVCAALCLSVLRHRLEAEQLPWQLDDEAALELRLEWLAKMPKRIKHVVARFLSERGMTASDLAALNLSESALKLMT